MCGLRRAEARTWSRVVTEDPTSPASVSLPCPAPALLHQEPRPTPANDLAGGAEEASLSPRAKCPPPAGCQPARTPFGSPHGPQLPLVSAPTQGVAISQGGLWDSRRPLLCCGPSSLFLSRSHVPEIPPSSPRVGPTEEGTSPPAWPGCLRLHCRCWVMYGPLALPGSDSGWMGSAEGGLGARSGSGSGGGAWRWRKLFPEHRPP